MEVCYTDTIIESLTTITQQFKYPNIEKEMGEFERVAGVLGIETSVLLFQARKGEMITLNEERWQQLENTDSNSFEAGNWNAVKEHSEAVGRDWNNLKNKLTDGEQLDAPIIVQYGDKYHLVSGNTRLMVARALGIKPSVLLFQVEV